MQSQETSQQDFLNATCQADYGVYMEELLYKNSQDNFYKEGLRRENLSYQKSITNENKQVLAQKLMQ